MLNTYLGQFNNSLKLTAYNKQLKIKEYKNLAARFNLHPSMEISSMLSDLAITLHNYFSLTWEEIEQLEA